MKGAAMICVNAKSVFAHQHYIRSLLYTGITRAKPLVILLVQKKAVAIAVKNVSGRRGWRLKGLEVEMEPETFRCWLPERCRIFETGKVRLQLMATPRLRKL
jgi:hypothetical protein